MKDCVLLADVFNDFAHADGERLLASFESSVHGMRDLLDWADEGKTPVVYANDSFGMWSGNASAIVERARNGAAGGLVDIIAPTESSVFLVKPRYSAFDHTPLRIVLGELGIERILLGGMATERCVAQTAIDAREEGLKVTVVEAACASVDVGLAQIALTYLREVVGAFVVGEAASIEAETRARQVA